MSVARPIFVVSLSLTIAACSGENPFRSPSGQAIANPQQYPWCQWRGDVRNGKPHGWGVGGCVAGQESDAHRGLMPAIQELQEGEEFIPERDSPTERVGLTSAKENQCKNELAIVMAPGMDYYITFRGHYVDGKRQNKGSFFYPDGSIYIGNWINDQREGDGVLFNSKCRIIFAGRWQEDWPVSTTNGR